MVKITHNSLETIIDGKDVSLTRMESKLLTILLDGRVHTRAELLARVWKADSTMKTRTIDVTIGRLKRKLGPMGKYLKSIHGVGYRLTSKRDK